jgi:hypothetical protein
LIAAQDGTLRRCSARVQCDLVSWGGVAPPPHERSAAPRSVLLVGKVCRSRMHLAQRHVNFGATTLHNASLRSKAIVIINESAVPLVYALSEQSTIAAQALDIAREQRVGIVMPFRSKELVFAFRPTFTGAFSESLAVQNVFDRSNDVRVTFKAQVGAVCVRECARAHLM